MSEREICRYLELVDRAHGVDIKDVTVTILNQPADTKEPA